MCMSIPGQIVEIVDAERRLGRVDFGGQQKMVNLAMLDVDEGAAGEWVMVQAGLAVSHLSEAEAQEALNQLRRLEQMYEEMLGNEEANQ